MTDNASTQAQPHRFASKDAGPDLKNMDGVSQIEAERLRQQAEEGFSIERDDLTARHGELARAAAAYAEIAAKQAQHPVRAADIARINFPIIWPWQRKWWKPADNARRNLQKAGALIAAELDRLPLAEARQAAEAEARQAEQKEQARKLKEAERLREQAEKLDPESAK